MQINKFLIMNCVMHLRIYNLFSKLLKTGISERTVNNLNENYLFFS